jgi:hypothetical protein
MFIAELTSLQQNKLIEFTSSLAFVIFEVLIWDTLHAVDLDLNVATVGLSVGHLVNSLLVHLHAMN